MDKESHITPQKRFNLFEILGISDNVFGILDVLFYVGSVTAFLPVTRVKDKSGYNKYVKCRAKWSNMVPLGYMLILAVTLPCVRYFWIFKPLESKKMCDFLLLILTSIEGIIVCLTSVVLFLRQDEYLRAYDILYELDQTFKKLGIRFTYKYINIFVFSAMNALLGFIIGTPFMGGLENTTYLDIFESLNIYGGFGIRQAPSLIYFSLIGSVCLKLWFLNCRIIDLCNIPTEYEKLCEEIDQIAWIHFQLCRVHENLHSSLSIAITGNMVQTSLVALILVSSLFENDERRNEFSFWMFANGSLLWTLIIVCEYTIYESNRTAKLLSGINVPIDYLLLNIKVTNTLLQMKHKFIKISSAGLFDINAQLISKHVALLATLVLFLLQIRDETLGKMKDKKS